MTKNWVLTQDYFEALLAWLSQDREQAGEKYEYIRQSLIQMYTWHGYSDAEDLADETINRVTPKVHELRKTYIGDPALYFYGVAKKMLLELHRRELVRETLREETVGSYGHETEAGDSAAEHRCLDQCIQKLSPENRKLILQYYQEEKRAKIDFRQEVAHKLGIEVNNLRVRVHRIRAILQKCIEECLTLK